MREEMDQLSFQLRDARVRMNDLRGALTNYRRSHVKAVERIAALEAEVKDKEDAGIFGMGKLTERIAALEEQATNDMSWRKKSAEHIDKLEAELVVARQCIEHQAKQIVELEDEDWDDRMNYNASGKD